MTDELYWDNHDELEIYLGREPSYEEVIEYMAKKYKISEEEEKEFNRRKMYEQRR